MLSTHHLAAQRQGSAASPAATAALAQRRQQAAGPATPGRPLSISPWKPCDAPVADSSCPFSLVVKVYIPPSVKPVEGVSPAAASYS